MLSAVAVTGVDHRNWGHLCRALRAAGFVMANNDHVRVAANNADRVFDLLAFHLRRKRTSVFGREYASAEPVHGSFEAEARTRGWLVKKRRHDAVLVVERAAAGDDLLHLARAVEQFHQKRNGELL